MFQWNIKSWSHYAFLVKTCTKFAYNYTSAFFLLLFSYHAVLYVYVATKKKKNYFTLYRKRKKCKFKKLAENRGKFWYIWKCFNIFLNHFFYHMHPPADKGYVLAVILIYSLSKPHQKYTIHISTCISHQYKVFNPFPFFFFLLPLLE